MKTPVFSNIKGTLFLLFFIPFTSICSLGVIAAASIGGISAAHGLCRTWSRLSLMAAGVRLNTRGIEQIPPGPVIFMCNHQGAFDIPALFATIPFPFAWLAKKELFSVPIFGRAMAAGRHIPMDRENSRNALNGIRHAAKALRNGASMAIFPEGTRSCNEQLLPFKRGAFLLASLASVPVVPVVISGSGRVLPPRSIALRGGTVGISFLPPVTAAGKKADLLMEEVHGIMADALQQQ